MVVETETIQLFQLIGFRVSLRDSRSWLKKFIPMSYNAPIFRINDSWPRTRRSLLLKQVQQSSWTIDQKIYSSNFLRSEAFLTYIVSYFKSGIKDLSWKKKAHSCSSVSFPPVLSSWMKYIRMISSPWVYIHACLISVRNVHKAKGYISFSQQLVSVRHSYHIREDRSCLEGPKCLRSISATNRKSFKQTSFPFTLGNWRKEIGALCFDIPKY